MECRQRFFEKKTAVRTLTERKAMIESKHPQLSIVKQCDLLCLNRSSIYNEPAKESEENLQILRWLDNRYQETPFAGARKLIKELEKHGYKLNMKRLRRLMAIQGWRTLSSGAQHNGVRSYEVQVSIPIEGTKDVSARPIPYCQPKISIRTLRQTLYHDQAAAQPA
jgi:hypothetical protein